MAWWSRPVVRWRGRRVPVFPVVGAISVAGAVGLGWALGRAVGIPAVVLAAMAAAALGALVVDIVGQAAARGRVNLVAFREAGLALAAAAVCCAALGHGVRPGLDVTAVAVAAGLAGGRLGCLAAGCCHGRPARVGVRYGAEHVALGFPAALAGVRVVGVPAWEAAALAVLASVGAGLAVGAPAGTAFGVLAGGYAAVRAVLDGFRGDGGRPRWAGLSSVVPVAAAVGAGLVVAGAVGALPAGVQGAGWAALAAAGATALRARACPARLRAPEHLAELVAAADGAGPVTTSAGVRVSAGRVTTPDGPVAHYTLSATPPLRPVEVRVLARQLRHLRHPDALLTAVPGRAGVIHLVAAGG